MTNIREMQNGDIERIMEINAAYPEDKIAPEAIVQFNDTQEGVCLIAEENAKIVGFILLAVTQKGATILDVETDTEYLGSNVTGILIQEAQRKAVEMGATAFYKSTTKLSVSKAKF